MGGHRLPGHSRRLLDARAVEGWAGDLPPVRPSDEVAGTSSAHRSELTLAFDDDDDDDDEAGTRTP